MHIQTRQTVPAGAMIIAVALTLAGCAGEPTKTQTTTSQHSSTSSQYQPPVAQQQAGQAAMGGGDAGSQFTANTPDQGAHLDLNQTPIGKTQDQAAGSIGYQEERHVMTTQTVNRTLPTVKQTTLKADINRMSATDFVALGIPKGVAGNIIKSRDEHGGKFSSVDDLKQVPGMSTAWVDAHENNLGVSTGSVPTG